MILFHTLRDGVALATLFEPCGGGGITMAVSGPDVFRRLAPDGRAVRLSDRPLDCNEGAGAGPLLRVHWLGDSDQLEQYKSEDEGKHYQEWVVPVDTLYRRALLMRGGESRWGMFVRPKDRQLDGIPPATITLDGLGAGRGGLIDPAIPRMLIAEADVVLAVDIDSGREMVIFGRRALDQVRLHARPKETLSVLRVEIDDEDADEHRTLAYWIESVKGKTAFREGRFEATGPG